MQIAISISDTSIDSVGPPYATFVYVVVVVFFSLLDRDGCFGRLQ